MRLERTPYGFPAQAEGLFFLYVLSPVKNASTAAGCVFNSFSGLGTLQSNIVD